MPPVRALPLARQLFRQVPGIWAPGLDRHMRRRYRDRAPTRLDVMTSFSGCNLEMVQVMILSLSETHPLDQIRLWLFEQDIPEPEIAALAGFCAGLGNVALHPVRVPDAEGFSRLQQLGSRPDSARFLWFVAHQQLPDDLGRVIYLDATDIIVTGDLVPC